MASTAPRRMTFDEFLEWDDGTDRRYQLLDGVPLMMAPALEAHGELVAAAAREIGNRLERPCRVVAEAGIKIPERADTFYVTDLAVTCAPRERGRRHVVEPVVIAEVLSPSTESIDRWRKVIEYRRIPTVRAILLISADERHVEVQRRTSSGWMVEDLIGQAEVTLESLTSPMPLDAIYGDLLDA